MKANQKEKRRQSFALLAGLLLLALGAVRWFEELAPEWLRNSPFMWIPTWLLPVAALICFITAACPTLQNTFAAIKARPRTAIILSAIVVLHLLLHIPAFLMPAGANDNDTGTYGIMAMHIADGNIRPAQYLGKNYIGTVIPHLAAGLFKTFGVSFPAIRLINAVFYCGFIICIFLLAQKGFGELAGLFAAGLATVTPYAVFNYLKYTEFPEIAFWGALSLVLLARLLDSSKVRWSDALLYGWALGMGFWAHPQMVYFVLAGGLAMLIARPRLAIDLRSYLVVPGFLLGWTPAILHFSHYGWNYFFNLILPSSSGGAGAGIIERLGVLVGHTMNYIGVTAGGFHHANHEYLFGHVTAIVTVLIFAGLLLIFFIRNFEKQDNTESDHESRNTRLIFVALIVTVPMLFILSGRSDPEFTSARYIFPLWVAVPVVIASGARWLMKKQLQAGVALLAGFLIIFGAGYFEQTKTIAANQQLVGGWIKRLDDFGTRRLVAPRYRSYWITYVTRERIIGAALLPFGGEAYTPYRDVVLGGSGPIAYLFDERLVPGSDAARETLERRLNQLTVTYLKEVDDLGTHIYGLSQQVSPRTIASLTDERYSAHIETIRQSLILNSNSSDTELRLYEIDVLNSGGADWFRENQTGFIELVVYAADGSEIRRQPLMHETPAGEVATWKILLTYEEARGAAAILQVNEIGILPDNKPVKISSVQSLDSMYIGDFDAVQAPLNSESAEKQPWCFLSGWTKTIEREGSIRSFTHGHTAKLGFIVAESRPLSLELRLRPAENPHWKPESQKVRILLNSSPLTEDVAIDDLTRLVLDLPKTELVRGLNTLSIEVAEILPLYDEKSMSLFMRRPGVVITAFEFSSK